MKLPVIQIAVVGLLSLVSLVITTTVSAAPPRAREAQLQRELDQAVLENSHLKPQIDAIRKMIQQNKAVTAEALRSLETQQNAVTDVQTKRQEELHQAFGYYKVIQTPHKQSPLKLELKTIDEIIKQNQQLNALVESLEGAVNSLKKRNYELAKRVVLLKNTLRLHDIHPEYGDDKGLAPKGKIIATKGNLVVISIGGDDGLKAGHECNIFRGSKFIGRIQINSVKPDRGVGIVDPNITKDIPKIGDSVESRTRINKLTKQPPRVPQNRMNTSEKEAYLTDQVERLQKALQKAGVDPSDILIPKGRIIAITKGKLVEISIGSENGVKVKQQYNIFRGELYITTVEIIKTTPDRSVATAMPNPPPSDLPKTGDRVELKDPTGKDKEEKKSADDAD